MKTIGHIHVLNHNNFSMDYLVNRIKTVYTIYRFKPCKVNKADIKLKLFYNPKSKWFCIFSSILKDVNADDILRQAKLFKKMFLTDVIATHVSNDCLLMSLEGKQSDYYRVNNLNNNIENKHFNGAESRWVHLLNKESDTNKLRDYWDNKPLIYEKFRLLSELLGFDIRLSKLEYDNLDVVDNTVYKEYQSLELYFMYSVRPYKIIKPRDHIILQKQSELISIYTNKDVNITITNKGKTSSGIAFVLSGEAVDNKLFKFVRVEILSNKKSDKIIAKIPFVRARVDGKRVLIAKQKNFTIPQGIVVKYSKDFEENLAFNTFEMLENEKKIMKKSQITFRIKALKKQTFDAQVSIKVIPLKNKEGSITFNTWIENEEE